MRERVDGGILALAVLPAATGTTRGCSPRTVRRGAATGPRTRTRTPARRSTPASGAATSRTAALATNQRGAVLAGAGRAPHGTPGASAPTGRATAWHHPGTTGPAAGHERAQATGAAPATAQDGRTQTTETAGHCIPAAATARAGTAAEAPAGPAAATTAAAGTGQMRDAPTGAVIGHDRAGVVGMRRG